MGVEKTSPNVAHERGEWLHLWPEGTTEGGPMRGEASCLLQGSWKNALSHIELKLQPGFPYLPPECKLPSWLLGLFSPVQTPHLYPVVSTQQNTSLCTKSSAFSTCLAQVPAYTHTLGLAAAVQLVFRVFCFRTAIISSIWQVQS